jgi:hypothetical protein
MRKLALIGAAVLGAAILSAAPISIRWSAISMAPDKAHAVIPITPGRFGDMIKGGYEVRGSMFFSASDKGLVLIQRGTSVLTCDFDRITHESGSSIKPGDCRELDK